MTGYEVLDGVSSGISTAQPWVMANQNSKAGSEVARDAARDDHGPKQHGREWGETVDDTKRPPPSDEGLQRDIKVTREKYATPKPDEN